MKCFGKFDSEVLVLCDNCDLEIHVYILKNELSIFINYKNYLDNLDLGKKT